LASLPMFALWLTHNHYHHSSSHSVCVRVTVPGKLWLWLTHNHYHHSSSHSVCVRVIVPGKLWWWLTHNHYHHSSSHSVCLRVIVRTIYIISLKMGDIDIHYLLNVNVSHFKADNIFVRTWLHKIVLFCVLNPMRWPI
jgi:hypothetical protein